MAFKLISHNKALALTARLLLAVFGILIAPPEFYHSFESHSDTHCRNHNDVVIEKQHQHCAILRFECPAFLTAASPATIAVSFVNVPVADRISDQLIRLNFRLPQLRAPPTV